MFVTVGSNTKSNNRPPRRGDRSPDLSEIPQLRFRHNQRQGWFHFLSMKETIATKGELPAVMPEE